MTTSELVPCLAFIAQLAEHALSKRKVTSSILVEGFLIRYGVVGNISACHADARGSIPRFGVFIFFLRFIILFLDVSVAGPGFRHFARVVKGLAC